MTEAVKLAKIPPPNSFHILRHTYASLYLMGGGSLEGLARQLGHADTRMTIRSYAHLAETWRAEEARKHAPSFGLQLASHVVPVAGLPETSTPATWERNLTHDDLLITN